jgi:hypothetical protein
MTMTLINTKPPLAEAAMAMVVVSLIADCHKGR